MTWEYTVVGSDRREQAVLRVQRRTNVPTSPKRASIQTQIRIAVNPDEQSFLEGLARRAGLSLSNYVRTALGMPVISAGRPTAKQEAERAEWARCKRAELHPGNK
jgi:phage tail tape-measure protein